MAFARRDECIVEEALPSMLAMEDCRYQSSRSPRSRADIASSFNAIRPVGRVLFNPPFQARWRVKENPPYALPIEAAIFLGRPISLIAPLLKIGLC